MEARAVGKCSTKVPEHLMLKCSERLDSSVSVESSDGFESSTTDESEYSEDDDGLMQSLHPTKPGQLCYLSFDLFSLTMGYLRNS